MLRGRCSAAWAPAQQRTAEEALRCVRGTRLVRNCIHIIIAMESRSNPEVRIPQTRG
jgi:hypothetical protein